MKTKILWIGFIIACIVAFWAIISWANHYSFAKEQISEKEELEQLVSSLERAVSTKSEIETLMEEYGVNNDTRYQNRETITQLEAENEALRERNFEIEQLVFPKK